jgi:hypothetical protein
MANVTLSLVGADGDEIVFTDDGEFVMTAGLTGLGIPQSIVRIDDSASDGGTWRFTKRGIREMDIPVVVFGATRDDVETNLRRLSNLLHDRSGGTTLRASYDTGEVWELPDGHYVAGAESIRGDDSGLHWCRWVLTMQFANPFWVRQQAQSLSLGAGVTGRSLIPDLAEMRISSSQAIGALSVENIGDVDAYPVWSFRGPMDSVTVTAADGSAFSYDVAIPLGTTITVDTIAGTVKNQSGTNLYANLGVSPKMFPFPAGTSTVSVVAVNVTSNSLITVYYQPRKEVIH